MTKKNRESSDADADAGDGKGNDKRHYKFWVLAAIILVALWFMFTASLTLKWYTGNLTRFSDDFDYLDVLEVEEREKVVRHMWDVYTHTHTHTNTIRLPRFWSEAFQAAYEHLVSDVPAVRDAAVSAIAKMSLRSLNLHQLPLQLQSPSSIGGSRKIKQPESSVDSTVASNQQQESFVLLVEH